MNMYRHDSLYRQRGLTTSSANLDSAIPLIYIYTLHLCILLFDSQVPYTAKNKR